MRVAHLDTGRSWRGGQAQVALLLRGLGERGCENLLLAPSGPLLERARQAGFRTARWEAHGDWDVGALMSATRALARARPEVVHCHSAHAHALGVPAARLARVPAVVVSRRVDFGVARNPLSALKYRMPVDRYLCISRDVMRVMAESGVKRERLALVPSGIEFPSPEACVAEAAAPDLRSLIGAPPDARVVGTVAALAPHKNHHDLLVAALEVARRLPDVHFAWVGDGELRAALLGQRARLDLEKRVHLLGFRPDAPGLMRQFTVFALSSYLEGLCTSLLDAQIRRVPVVATRVGGVPELVEDGVSGRLVPPRDPGALARALVEALESAETRRVWAERAHASVQAFSAELMVERSLAEYRAVLEGRTGEPRGGN